MGMNIIDIFELLRSIPFKIKAMVNLNYSDK